MDRLLFYGGLCLALAGTGSLAIGLILYKIKAGRLRKTLIREYGEEERPHRTRREKGR